MISGILNMNRVIGYGICGRGESKRYMKATLDEFKRLCDDTIILLNGAGKAERSLIRSYGFKMAQDDREWGKTQNTIKQDFVTNCVAKLTPDWLICLDMDEIFEPKFTRQELEKLTEDGWAFHFYIANLWGEGYKPRRCFWNVRMWKWNGDTEFLNRPLHPGLAPKWAYMINQYAPFIVRHYGLKEKKDRLEKIERYEKYDPNAKFCSREYYNDLKTDDFAPYDEGKLHKEVDAYVKKYKPKIKRQPIMLPKKEFTIIKRTNLKTGEVFGFEVATKEVPLYLNQNTKDLRFEVEGKAAEVTDEIEELFKEPKVDIKPENEEPVVAKKPVKKLGRPKKAK
jgi:hypothetical protein